MARAVPSASPVPRMSRDERRAQLLAVALELFAARGYHATSIDHIIQKASVARGTFYLHFRSKKEIFDSLLDHLFERVAASISPIQIGPPAAMAAEVRANLVALCTALQDNLPMGRVILEQAVGLNDVGREQLRGFYTRVLDRIERAISVGQQLGLVRPGDPPLIAICLLGMVKESLYQQIVGTRAFSTEQVVDEIFACMQKGVLNAPPR
jgi:AcrR family transcriptional regulator